MLRSDQSINKDLQLLLLLYTFFLLSQNLPTTCRRNNFEIFGSVLTWHS